MKLKISFILRISSIILQCLIFYTLETKSWSLLSKLLNHATCNKFSALKDDPVATNKLTPIKEPRKSKRSKHNKVISDANKNNSGTEPSDDDETDDEVFIDETRNKPTSTKKPKNKPTSIKKSKTIEEIMTDESDSDDDTKAIQEQKLSAQKTDITSKLSKKRDETEEEKRPIKRTTSNPNKTNGISKQTSNEKATSQRISSAMTDKKISKSKTNQTHVQYDPIKSDSSTGDISNASVNSDDEIKPTTTKPKIQPTIHSSPTRKKRTQTVTPSQHHVHYRRHRITRPHVSRPIGTTSNSHNHRDTTKMRTKSPRNNNNDNHTEKPKQDRLSLILANSVEV
jgi:hypothetical protein